MKNTTTTHEIKRFLGFYYMGRVTATKARKIARKALELLLNNIMSPYQNKKEK